MLLLLSQVSITVFPQLTPEPETRDEAQTLYEYVMNTIGGTRHSGQYGCIAIFIYVFYLKGRGRTRKCLLLHCYNYKTIENNGSSNFTVSLDCIDCFDCPDCPNGPDCTNWPDFPDCPCFHDCLDLPDCPFCFDCPYCSNCTDCPDYPICNDCFWVIMSHCESLWVNYIHFESLWVILSNFKSLWDTLIYFKSL